MNISIIIPFVNEKEELFSTIESIEKYKGRINHYEIITINDASDDMFDEWKERVVKFSTILSFLKL